MVKDMTHLNKLQTIKQVFKKDTIRAQPWILELLNRSGHSGGLARRKLAKEMADVYLQSLAEDCGLMAYGRGDKIAETAYQSAVNQIQMWPNIEALQDKPQ